MANNSDIETARHDERIKALEKHSDECDKDRAAINSWKLTLEAAANAKNLQMQAIKAMVLFWVSIVIGVATAISWCAHFLVSNLDAVKIFLLSIFSTK